MFEAEILSLILENVVSLALLGTTDLEYIQSPWVLPEPLQRGCDIWAWWVPGSVTRDTQTKPAKRWSNWKGVTNVPWCLCKVHLSLEPTQEDDGEWCWEHKKTKIKEWNREPFFRICSWEEEWYMRFCSWETRRLWIFGVPGISSWFSCSFPEELLIDLINQERRMSNPLKHLIICREASNILQFWQPQTAHSEKMITNSIVPDSSC